MAQNRHAWNKKNTAKPGWMMGFCGLLPWVCGCCCHWVCGCCCHWVCGCCRCSCCCNFCSCCCCWCSRSLLLLYFFIFFSAIAFCFLPWIPWNLAVPMASKYCSWASCSFLVGCVPSVGPAFVFVCSCLRLCCCLGLLPFFAWAESSQTKHPGHCFSMAFLPSHHTILCLFFASLPPPSSGFDSHSSHIFPMFLLFPGYLGWLSLLATLCLGFGGCHFCFFLVGLVYPSLGNLMRIALPLPLSFSRLSRCALFKAVGCLVRAWIWIAKGCVKAISKACTTALLQG